MIHQINENIFSCFIFTKQIYFTIKFGEIPVQDRVF